jgi:hypothetical protein
MYKSILGDSMIKNTRLVMFEGLPGSGKSTNSYFSFMQLEQNDKKVKWIHEVAHPHPIIPEFDNWVMPLDEYKNFVLKKSVCFVKNNIHEDLDFLLLDSGIFQFHIFNFLLKNTPYYELKNFIDKIINEITPLNPCLIYLYRNNVEDSISFLEKSRNLKSFERIWERDRFQPYYNDKPEGAEGFKQFLRDYAVIAEQLYETIDCRKHLIDISSHDWMLYEDKILSFLGIERKSYPNTLPSNGIYKNEILNMVIEVNGLSIIDPEGKERKLTPKSNYEFYVECLPVILNFSESKKIIITGAQIIAQWTTLGMQYIKI